MKIYFYPFCNFIKEHAGVISVKFIFLASTENTLRFIFEKKSPLN